MKILIDIIVLICIYVYLYNKKLKTMTKRKIIINSLLYLYICLVLYATLMPIITSIPFIFNHPYNQINLIPFVDVMNNRGDFVRQVLLNVIMLMPFGFLLPFVNKKYSFKKIVLYTFLFSLSIELLQPLISGVRSADITDLITNTLGGVIGYILYCLFISFIKKLRRKNI